MIVRLAGVIESSLSNGRGIRKVIFAQGCKHKCPGCFNPGTHGFEGGYECDTDKLIDSVNSDFIINGVTFSGGDPFEQASEFAEIAKNINSDKDIWCYTGYEWEDILDGINNGRSDWFHLLQNIDVIVVGKFIISELDDELEYAGSSNQRIIDVQESLINKTVVLYDCDRFSKKR